MLPGTQFGDQHLLDIDLEGDTVDRAAEHEGGDHAAHGEPGDEGRGLPVAVRPAHAQALAARRAAVSTRHVGLGPGLVDEDQLRRIEPGLAVAPGLAPGQHVGAILLAGMAGLLLARHVVAHQETLDGAVAEAQPAPGKPAAQLPRW